MFGSRHPILVKTPVKVFTKNKYFVLIKIHKVKKINY